YSLLKPYTSDGSRSPVCTVAFMHMFCIGIYMAFVRGLYAPAGQFLPPFVPGHTMIVSSLRVNTRSESSVTLPVAPSMFLTTFWKTVGRAHRNSPVLRS